VATSHRIKEISAEMCHLVNQQSKVLSSEIRFAEMSEEEVAGYLERMHHDSLALLRQRIYQIVGGYEDANDADRLRHDPMLQIVADRKLGDALGSQPTLSRWENARLALRSLLSDAYVLTRTAGMALTCMRRTA
jgi:Transposase DDE domain group 1